MKRQSLVVILCVMFGSIASATAEHNSKSADWEPVDQEVWTVLMEAPQLHLLAAQEDLSKKKKDTKGAAEEIRRAGTFLQIQQKRLASASRQLSDLARDIEAGKIVSPKEVTETFNKALSALDYRQPLIPVMSGADTLYDDEASYHLTKANRDFVKKDFKVAAEDIRKAAAYLRVKAIHAGEDIKSMLLASSAELEELAKKVKNGSVTAAKELKGAFSRAYKAVRRTL